MTENHRQHGAAYYRCRTPCRCATCCEAHRLRHIAERAARYARRVLVDGRLIVVNPAVRHGTASTYANWGCRCDECCAANTRHSALIRERKTR